MFNKLNFIYLQMGAVIFALTDTVETAADLAARSGGKQELVQLLRAVEGKGQSTVRYYILRLQVHKDEQFTVQLVITRLSKRKITPSPLLLSLFLTVAHLLENAQYFYPSSGCLKVRTAARLDRMQTFFVFSSYIMLFQWMLRYRNYKKSCKLHQVRSLKCNYYKVVQKPRQALSST